jgi:hypothetical protein
MRTNLCERVYTNSGDVKMKEAYAYELEVTGVPVPSEPRKA